MFTQFQDPLISGFARITIQNSSSLDRNLILDIADTIQKARVHPKPSSVFSRSGDPVLERVFDFLDRKRFHISWSKLVLLGCSAGGNVALRSLFKHLIVPHIPIIIVMHHNPGFKFLTKLDLANSTFQRIIPVKDGEPIRGSRLYFLPGEMETGFSRQTKSFVVKPVNYKQRFRPDIDKAFAAAGARFRENVIGVILSGMLNDGAEGTKTIFLNRGEVWVQQPSTALFKEMPNAAIKTVPTVKIKTLQQIAEKINQISLNDLTIKPI